MCGGNMIDQITHITIMVDNQAKALKWYEEKLDFQKRVDDSHSVPGVRWLTIAPREDQGIEIVLFQAQNENDHLKIGKNTMWIFKTDNCRQATQSMRQKGVHIVKECEDWPWGISTIFEDLYGNYYNLVELRDE